MKERLVIFIVGFAVSCLAIKRLINTAGETGTVENWVDADTFIAKLPTETVTVRLNAVDSPELNSPGGKDALAFIQQLVGDQPVRVLEFRRNTDGDIVGEVYTMDNVSLNEALMKAGWAWFYEPDSTNNPYYRELNDQAVEEKLGLWSLGEPAPPWETVARKTAR
jgi:endonuclease YncB( thermonuclease family)